MKGQEIQKTFWMVHLKKTDLLKALDQVTHKESLERKDIMFHRVWIRKWLDMSGQLQASATTDPAKRDLGNIKHEAGKQKSFHIYLYL
jgi:hypothetical protein